MIINRGKCYGWRERKAPLDTPHASLSDEEPIPLTCQLIDPLLPALAVLSLFSGLFALLSLIAVAAALIALPDLALLPLDDLRAGLAPELRLQLYHPRPDHVTFPT